MGSAGVESREHLLNNFERDAGVALCQDIYAEREEHSRLLAGEWRAAASGVRADQVVLKLRELIL